MKNDIYKLLIVFFFVLTKAFGDVGPITIIGESIELKNSTNVELVSEEIEITLRPGSANVLCDFYLRNTGKEEVVQIAFPGGEAESMGDEIWYRGTKDFRVFINDKEIKTIYHKQPPDSSREWYGWYTWATQFGASQSLHIRVTYKSTNRNFGYTYNPYGDFTYILETGANWAGKISEAKISIKFEDMDICQVTDFSPSNGVVNLNKTITWDLRNFEPDNSSNIKVWYEIDLFNTRTNPPYASFGWEYLKSKNAFELIEKLDFNKFLSFVDIAAKVEYDSLEWYWSEYGEVQRAKELIMEEIIPIILETCAKLEKQGKWLVVKKIYDWCLEIYKDIPSDLRPYSVLNYRLAECYKQIGDTTRALEYFKACMDTIEMTEYRYNKALKNMVGEYEFDYIINDYPYNSEESNIFISYFLSKGLNEYCRINIEAMKTFKKLE